MLSAPNRVSANSSNIGIKGVEDLGGSLKAWFQVENGSLALATGNATAPSNSWAGRNTGVGLTGNSGTIFLGNWDTPYKSSTGDVDAMYNTGIANVVDITSGNATPTPIKFSDKTNLKKSSLPRQEANLDL